MRADDCGIEWPGPIISHDLDSVNAAQYHISLFRRHINTAGSWIKQNIASHQ